MIKPMPDTETTLIMVELDSGDGFLVMNGEIVLSCNEFESEATRDMYDDACALIAQIAQAAGAQINRIDHEAPEYARESWTEKNKAYIEVATSLGLLKSEQGEQKTVDSSPE